MIPETKMRNPPRPPLARARGVVVVRGLIMDMRLTMDGVAHAMPARRAEMVAAKLYQQGHFDTIEAGLSANQVIGPVTYRRRLQELLEAGTLKAG